MARQRIVNTNFYRDRYILSLDTDARFLFIWAITNPATDLCGAYESPLPIIEVETGLRSDRIVEIFEQFTAAGKMLYKDGWVIIQNFSKHQNTTSTNIQKGIERSLSACPAWVKDTLQRGIDTLPVDTLPEPELKPEPNGEEGDAFASFSQSEISTSQKKPARKITTAAETKPQSSHQRLMEHHHNRIGRISDGAAQAASIKAILKHYDESDAINCYEYQLTSWREDVSWKTVNKSIAEWVVKGRPPEYKNNGQSYKQQDAERAVQSANRRKQIEAELRQDGLLDNRSVLRIGGSEFN